MSFTHRSTVSFPHIIKLIFLHKPFRKNENGRYYICKVSFVRSDKMKINKGVNIKDNYGFTGHSAREKTSADKRQETISSHNNKNANEAIMSQGKALIFQGGTSDIISAKALYMLEKNNIDKNDYTPQKTIVTDTDKLSDIYTAFQRKLAIDRMHVQNKTTKTVYDTEGNKQAEIKYNDEGKPDEIIHYTGSDTVFKQKFNYAQKQNGSYVLSSETVTMERDGEEIPVDNIKYYKHHSGNVTISNQSGQQMTYDLKNDRIYNVIGITKTKKAADAGNNTPIQPQKQPLQENQSQEKFQTKEIFVKPKTNYPQAEYSPYQKQIIKNKFDSFKKEVEESNYTFDSRIDDLNDIEKSIESIKDPKLQKAVTDTLHKMKDNYVPSDNSRTWTQVNMRDDYSGFRELGDLITLNNCLRNDYITISPSGMPKKNAPNLNIFDTNVDEKTRFNSWLKPFIDKTTDEDTGEKIPKEEYESQLNKEIYSIQMNDLSEAIDETSRKFPELEDYLYNTYLLGSMDKKHSDAMKKINEVKGKRIYPVTYGNFNYSSLDSFVNLPKESQEQFLKNPNLLKRFYLDNGNAVDQFGIINPAQVFVNFTPKDWDKFNKRNLNDIVDVICGIEKSRWQDVHTAQEVQRVLSMDDATWQKVEDFGLFKIKDNNKHLSSSKNRNLMFEFKDIEYIANNVTYDDWKRIKDRGILKIKPAKNYGIGNASNNNGQNHIGADIITALGKAPDSTYNFLKNKINLFEPVKGEETFNLKRYTGYEQQEYIAKGISYLSHAHNDTYERIDDLVNKAGFNPGVAMEILGVSAEKYHHFGHYLCDKAVELKNQNVNETDIPKILPLYTDLQFVKNKSDINELSIEEKRSYLKNLTKYNAQFFDMNFNKLLQSDIIPQNKDEYCALLPILVKSVGIDTRPVSREVIDNFNKATDEMSKPDSEFLNTNITKDGFKLELDYPRKDFINDVLKEVSDLPDNEKMKVYDYFGFELKKDKNNTVQMNGYPVNINKKLTWIDKDETRAVIENVRPLVERFTADNKITIEGKPELTKEMNDIVELFPEFKSVIGKEQHKTHDYTVDVHTLKVLQGVMSNPKYKTLSAEDKKLLDIATLMHDLTKAEGMIDKTHPQYSAYDTYYILDKMKMPEKDKIKVYQLIKNHDWSEKYNKKVYLGGGHFRDKTPQERRKAAKDIAFELRDGDNFKMASILAEADIKGVQESGAFYDKYKDALFEGEKEISALVNKIQETSIHLPQTKIPKASELKVDRYNVQNIKTEDKNGNEIENTVVFLKPNMDLGAYGFEKGLKSDDFNVIVHALDKNTQAAVLQALGQVDSDALLSSSYVTYAKGNYHTFRPQGFILDVNSSDIQAGTYKDFGSGYGKDLETLKTEYLFGGSRKYVREYIPNKIKKKLNLSNEEYKKMIPQISDKSISEIEKENPKIAQAYRDVFKEMDIHMRRYGRDYNEFLISRPKIQAVFYEGAGNRVDDIPEFLRKYAQENDMPIIYFGG